MTMTRRDRVRGTLLLAATAAGVLLGWAGPARAAGVSITAAPAQVHQGDAVRVTFAVPEERSGTRTERIEIGMPGDAPVGEVYPMSVPGWAPRIATRTLDRPVAGIHTPGVDMVTASVTWIRVPGATAGPVRLALGMGPMPATDRLAFQVVQTYGDGTVVRWTDPAGGAHPAPTLALLPAMPGAATGGHAGHSGITADGPGDPAAQAPADAAGADGQGPAADGQDAPSADLLLGGGLLAGLAGGAAIGWLFSRRRRGAMALAPEEADGAGHEDMDDSAGDADPSPADPDQRARPDRGDGGEPVLSGTVRATAARH
ncbi:DUF1775 domain-containing protein [Micromonospora sp. RTP1Z1]|uniref:DUF1775 domain-containing protein n=1 Tax=Micromonospora sp. RTP1Z1 TaxID=2994043 RepID=UPI0029C9ACAA|nr:DUF1775 domain-containing protein [Micromonospora sp. RTP1Z1]